MILSKEEAKERIQRVLQENLDEDVSYMESRSFDGENTYIGIELSIRVPNRFYNEVTDMSERRAEQ